MVRPSASFVRRELHRLQGKHLNLWGQAVRLVFDSEEFKLIVKQWVSGHTKSLGTTYRRSSQFE